MNEPNDSAFGERAFQETLRLIEDIRDHITSGDSRDPGETVEPASRMRAARDLSRLTNRTTAAMSILLLYRALEGGQAGDIADIPGRLDELLVAMMQVPPQDTLDTVPLPGAVASLVARADARFADVERVAAMIRTRVDA